jgi:1-deoxy-D-xylulose-5-phosphate reductoisomerase
MSAPQNVAILGATGSIGRSTLDVIARHPDRFCAFALTAHTQADELFELAIRHRPRFAVLAEGAQARDLRTRLAAAGSPVEVLAGPEALVSIAAHPDVDAVMAAIVGAAGLAPTLAAARAAKKILLANKEALVMAAPVFMAAVRQGGATLLPIDSEHNAIFQCLPQGRYENLAAGGVRKIVLTGSGGPFRSRPLAELAAVTPDEACAHPTWSMGRKISVDSATMMNKALEIIEAAWLFGASPDAIEVLVHPQSVIHSMVAYADGSVIAQLGNPDMRTPIAQALAHPDRIDAGVAALDLARIGGLTFEAPDFVRFRALALAYDVLGAGGTAPAVFNAANEIAVTAFLARDLAFNRITDVIEAALARVAAAPVRALDDVLEADRAARAAAREALGRTLSTTP